MIERQPQQAREAVEAARVATRLIELRLNPIQAKFDTHHLKAVHAYIFQDLPHHQPGITRGDTPDWTKTRVLEGRATGYEVLYAHDNIEERVTQALDGFGGPGAIKGLPPAEAAGRLASLYGDLDHAHAFYEGNSRTLREFTRELASAAGFKLDWTPTAIGAKERNALYVARDLAVLERAYPGLTPDKAMQTSDRAEYEASFVIEGLRRAVGDKSLEAIITTGLSVEAQRERRERPMDKRDSATPAKDAAAQDHAAMADKQRRELAARQAAMYRGETPEQTAQRERDDKTRDDHER